MKMDTFLIEEANEDCVYFVGSGKLLRKYNINIITVMKRNLFFGKM